MTIADRTRGRADVLVPAVVISVAFAVVALVWVLTGWWSFGEQTRLALEYGFEHPAVLFWATDGFAAGSALVALAAAIDNRPAPAARVGYVLALGASAWFNAAAAVNRFGSLDLTPPAALAMAAGVPVISFGALEIILRAIRATVRRWRGLPAPVGVPGLRPGRLLLAPRSSFREWRAMYLEATRPGALQVVQADTIRAELDSLGRALRADYRTELASVAAVVPVLGPAVEVPAPEVDRDDLDRLHGSVLKALTSFRQDSERTAREAVETAERTARTAAELAVREALSTAARTGAPTARPTGTARPASTGRTGAPAGPRPGATKRERYEAAYRSLVDNGNDPAGITGNDLAQHASGDLDARDTDGTGRRLLRDLRAEADAPSADVVPLGSRSGGRS